MLNDLSRYSIDSFIDNLLNDPEEVSDVRRDRIKASFVGGDKRLTKIFDFIMLSRINRADALGDLDKTKRSLKMNRWCRENLGYHMVDFSLCVVFVESDEDLIKLILRFSE